MLSTRTNYNGVVVDELEFPGLFPEWGDFNLLFNVDKMNLPLKNNGGET